MLVLSRKKGEQVRIGDDVVLTVLEVRGQQVKIGFEAPRSVDIVRGELVAMAEAHADRPLVLHSTPME